MTEQDEEDYRKDELCRFLKKKFQFDKVRDRCHLTAKNRAAALINCIRNLTHKQSNFIPFIFHNFSNFDC